MSMSPRIWFITGASRGFGLALVQRLLEAGEIAIATMRNTDNDTYKELQAKYSPDKLLTIPLDVTKEEQVESAFAKAKQVFGRIDVVFSNAGYTLVSTFEAVPISEARAIVEANFWGAVHVTRAALAFFRDVNTRQGGLIIQNSSMVAQGAPPLTSFYAASKAALEATMESLIQELDPAWNIKVTLIEPGAFRTEVLTKDLKIFEHPAYNNPNLPVVQVMAFMRNFNAEWLKGDPNKLVNLLFKLADLEKPPFRVLLGKDAWATAEGSRKRDQDDEDRLKLRAWSDDLEF